MPPIDGRVERFTSAIGQALSATFEDMFTQRRIHDRPCWRLWSDVQHLSAGTNLLNARSFSFRSVW